MLKKIIGTVILSSVLLCACGCSGNGEASEMSAAVTDNTAAQTTSATEQTTTAAQSTTTALSAVEKLPESEEAAASDDAAVTVEVTVSEETPVSEESAITEEAPVSEEAPATEEVTASEETPATEEVTVSEEAAVTAEAPVSEEAPETEEAAEPEPIVKILQGKPYIPDENATEDEQRMYGQYTEQREKYLQRYEKLAAQLDMPIVSIITLDKKAVLSKEEYVTSVVDVLNCDEEFAFSAAAGVRVRGNSTADGNEKPYRIKFDKKQNMLGLHEGNEYKSWVLLKSQWNLAMDYMGFTLADTILEDRYYSSDCTYVNVYINGAFKGIYLLCEQNQVGKDRVDIYEPTKDETGTDIGYLVEIDNYANEAEDPFFHVDYLGAELTDISGTTNTFVGADYSIKSDTY